MEFRVIFVSSRSSTIELLDQGIYFTDQEYEIWLDGRKAVTSRKVIQTVGGLKPDTVYHMEIRMGEKRAAQDVKTCYF